jgi:hypothetical protein
LLRGEHAKQKRYGRLRRKEFGMFRDCRYRITNYGSAGEKLPIRMPEELAQGETQES